MIVTVNTTFVDAPKGREEKLYRAGSVESISKADFERINGQNSSLLLEGSHRFGSGTCAPCTKYNNTKKR